MTDEEAQDTRDIRAKGLRRAIAGPRKGARDGGTNDGLSRRKLIVGGLAYAALVAALVVLGVVLHWSFSEAIGVAALVVSTSGFVVAIFEIHRARRVAVVTQENVDKALRKVERGRLTAAIAEMQGLVGSIEDACDQDDMKSFRIHSNRWRDLAGSAIALIGQRSGEELQVVGDLELARRLGREANQAIHEEGQTLREAASEYLAALAVAGDGLPLLAERMSETS